MMKLVNAIKKFIRLTLVWIIPIEIRRRIVARYPWLPLAPYSRGAASARFDGSNWERFYAAEDPYGLAKSGYELEKYQRTLDCIGEGPFERALEVGCSIGVFTAQLAPRCKELLAVDISDNAIAQARGRTAEFPQVILERRVLPKHMPSGPFDLIVCSDTLYYWPADSIRMGMRAFEEALTPGGRVVALHYTREIEPGAAMNGNAVHDLLTEEFRLEHTHSMEYEKYRLDRFEKTA